MFHSSGRLRGLDAAASVDTEGPYSAGWAPLSLLPVHENCSSQPEMQGGVEVKLNCARCDRPGLA